MRDLTTPQRPRSQELVRTLNDRASLAATIQNPNLTLVKAAATYLIYKRKRLTERSQIGYQAILDDFTAVFPKAKLAEFEPPAGSLLVEEHLSDRYGHLAERTYNKAHSVLSNFFEWHVSRGSMLRNPILTIERAKPRQARRITFTETQCARILAKNHDTRDQIALRLLLNYAIRKGALRGVQFEHFNPEKRELVVFTKGEKYHTVHIVEDTVWELLDELREPGHHYLLPRTRTRRRIPPKRKQLQQLAGLLESSYPILADAAADLPCARDLADALDALNAAGAAVESALDAASWQFTTWPEEPMGQHGLHLWWYRCLVRAGIVPPGTTAGRKMHSARHTAIQRVLDVTGNLKAAQAVAGHANISTTGNEYTDWSSEQTKDTLRKVLA